MWGPLVIKKMPQEDMASDQKSQARAEQRQQAMQELAVKVWLPGGSDGYLES